jgi:tripartite-type tricarboxylate transporter receptor subunit TctC
MNMHGQDRERRFGVRVSGLLVCLAAAALAGPATAQQYPTKPIEWIVMWSSGGGADTATRTFTRRFESELGQNIVVKNVTGGGGSIGYLTAKQARPDGYNLVTIQGDLPKFVPMQLADIKISDFDIIGGFAAQSPIIIARGDSPWKTLQEFVDDAKRNPGKRTIGVSDIGGVHHQPVVLWAKAAGIQIRAVAHAGSPQMNAAILGGHVDLVASYIRPAAPYVKEGKLRFLAYFGAERPADYPNTPTFKELGYDIVWEQPYGLGGPAGIPEAIKTKLAAAAAKVRKNTQFKSDINKLGLEVYDKNGPEFRDYLVEMQSDIGKVMAILKSQK